MEYVDNLPPGFIKLDPWSNACGRNDRVPQFSVIIDRATLHASTCTRSRLITYTLDSINGTIHEEERVEYHSPQ